MDEQSSTTYVESMYGLWHRATEKDGEFTTACGLSILPRNVWHGEHPGALCSECSEQAR